ncbi:MAG TPA: flagellar hook-length control protein FliK, partial [bacterium]|nr:flagellar hook-length control protein FliK [bacterium]
PITVPPPATATIEDAIDSPEPAAPVPPHDEPDLPVLGMSVSARQMPKAMTAFHVSTAEATAPIENQAAAEQAKTVAPAKVEGAAAPAGQLSARAPVDGAILVAPTAVHAAGSSAHQQHLGNGTGQGGQPTTAPMDATAKVDLSPGAATDAVKPQAGAKATALPPTPAQRIAAQIAVRLDKTVVPEGSSRVRLVVSPPELGQITIELTRQGDHLGTRLITRTLEAHALLERLLPDLRQQLEDRGYLMKHLDLAHQGMPDGQGDPRRFAYQRPETHDWMLPPVTREGTEETGDTPRIPHAAIERGLNLTV